MIKYKEVYLTVLTVNETIHFISCINVLTSGTKSFNIGHILFVF